MIELEYMAWCSNGHRTYLRWRGCSDPVGTHCCPHSPWCDGLIVRADILGPVNPENASQ